jgi:hypothetical protein
MIDLDVIIDDDVLKALNESLQKAPDITRDVLLKKVYPRIRAQAWKLLQTPPGAVKYPILWTSERQRRYVMAKLRRENNLPYKRTGKLLRDWRIDILRIENGIGFSVNNQNPAAKYVIGDRQQQFHLNTGWYQVDDKVIELSEYATNQLIDAWYSINWFEKA